MNTILQILVLKSKGRRTRCVVSVLHPYDIDKTRLHSFSKISSILVLE